MTRENKTLTLPKRPRPSGLDSPRFNNTNNNSSNSFQERRPTTRSRSTKKRATNKNENLHIQNNLATLAITDLTSLKLNLTNRGKKEMEQNKVSEIKAKLIKKESDSDSDEELEKPFLIDVTTTNMNTSSNNGGTTGKNKSNIKLEFRDKKQIPESIEGEVLQFVHNDLGRQTDFLTINVKTLFDTILQTDPNKTFTVKGSLITDLLRLNLMALLIASTNEGKDVGNNMLRSLSYIKIMEETTSEKKKSIDELADMLENFSTGQMRKTIVDTKMTEQPRKKVTTKRTKNPKTENKEKLKAENEELRKENEKLRRIKELNSLAAKFRTNSKNALQGNWPSLI